MIMSSLKSLAIPALAWLVWLMPATGASEVHVVATLPALAALARAVGGDLVSVTALAAPSQDPHFVDPKPSLVLALHRADLLLLEGLELETGWLPPLQTAARNPAITTGGAGYLDASTAVERLEVASGKVDRSQGDVHPQGNPHYLFDPRALARVALALGERLAALDPAHSSGFHAQAAAVSGELERFAREQRQRFASLPPDRRVLAVYHRSFPYLLDWLGLEEVAELEPRPGIPPDPSHVARVLAVVRARGVRVLLQEEYFPAETARSLASLTGAGLVIVRGGPRLASGETLQAWLGEVADSLFHALGR
jgi:zinc/manganese transport system substrate-binding protein